MLRFTVRFDRYTQENEDDSIADANFPEVVDPARRLLEQARSELGQNNELAGLWDTYCHRIIDDNLFCVWIGFDWPGEGVDFVGTLQNTYDVYGMSGFYEILDVVGDLNNDCQTECLGNRHVLKQWIEEVVWKAPAR